MQWQQIPEALNIRPCQRPKSITPRQLFHYPVKLKKLPHWIDNASFKNNKNKQNINQTVIQAVQKQIIIQNNETYQSLSKKYNNQNDYEVIYQRGQCQQYVNLNFAYEYIPGDYLQIQDYNPYSISKNYDNSPRKQKIKKNKIQFDSKFQCGNLSKCYKVKDKQKIDKKDNQYHLLMQNDINTLGYTQWYCFQIKNNIDQYSLIQIQIVNFNKSNSLYKNKMKPWIISQTKTYWEPISLPCYYRKTNVKNFNGQYYYELKFQLQIPPGVTYISMMPIYSYSRLSQKITQWQKIKGFTIYEKTVYTLLNNIVPVLQYIPQGSFYKDQQKKWLQTLVFTARIHPGEAWSSFLIQQFIQNVINFHRSHSRKIRYLFIPMLNPDGVIYGNFRCDFSGVDLNRVWIDTNKYTQSSIFQIKKILSKQLQSKKAKYFIDFHSHSKCYNLFAYTCGQTISEARLISDLIRLSNQNKIYDPISSLQEVNQQFINNSQTTYVSSKDIFYSDKKATARAFMSQFTQNGNAMTIQISFYGYFDKMQNLSKVWQIFDFSDFSWLLIKKLIDYVQFNDSVILAKKMLKPLYFWQQKTILERKKNQAAFKQLISQECVNSDSDSQPQRYYTAQTRKKMISKDYQNKNLKQINFNNQRKKRYLDQTESQLHRIQVVQKQKDNISKLLEMNQLTRQTKIKNMSLQMKKNHKFICRQYTNTSTKAQKNQKQIQLTDNEQKHHESQEKITLNKPSDMRRKIVIAAKLRNRKFKTESNISFQKKNYQVGQMNKCINEPNPNTIVEPIDLSIEISKKIGPTFGKFLPSSKRNASRKYKIILRQQIQMQKKYNLLQQKCGMKFKSSFCSKKDEQKVQSFLEDSTIILYNQKNQQFKDDKLKTNLPKKKDSSVKIIAANTDKYIQQRKKLLQMMKKQTRFNPTQQKQQLLGQNIEQIIFKRKRAKTESSNFHSSIKDKVVFLQKRIIQSMSSNDPPVKLTKVQPSNKCQIKNNLIANQIPENKNKIIQSGVYKEVIISSSKKIKQINKN